MASIYLEEVAEGSAEALAGFESSKARAPQASSSEHIVSTIPAFPLCLVLGSKHKMCFNSKFR